MPPGEAGRLVAMVEETQEPAVAVYRLPGKMLTGAGPLAEPTTVAGSA